MAILLACLAGYTAGAQQNNIALTGTLAMASGETFSYRIEGKDSGGTFTGYAYTFDEPQQTKVVIKGKINVQLRKLTFKEVEIVESHSVRTQAYMCLLHAILQDNGSTLAGPVTSAENDNTACTPGTLTFSDRKQIANVFTSHDKYDEVVDMGARKKEPKPAAAPAPVADVPPVTDKVTSGMEKSYEWTSDSMVIEIWDGGTFDGDVVTMDFDGTPVLKKFMIDKPHKRLSVPVPPGNHTFRIIAENEGTDPPNTASLMLSDGDKKYSILAYNEKGQISVIRIHRP